MNKILVVTLVGLLMAVGVVFTGCDKPGRCPGNGECTVTIDQNANGLFVDSNSPRSSCGKSATKNYNDDGSAYWTGGCEVQNNMDNINRKYGTHSCNC